MAESPDWNKIYEEYYEETIRKTIARNLEKYLKQGIKSQGKNKINQILQGHISGKSTGYKASILDGGPGWALSEGKFNQPIIQTFKETIETAPTKQIQQRNIYNFNRLSSRAINIIEKELQRRDNKKALPRGQKQAITSETKEILKNYEDLGITKYREKMREQGYTPAKAQNLVGKYERGETREL